jgi:hypothetical protein
MRQLGYAITEVKWLILERLRNLTKKRFISSVTRWTKLGDE